MVTGCTNPLHSNRGLLRFIDRPHLCFSEMAVPLACAQNWLLTKPCILSYSDIFYESSAVELLMESKAGLAVTYDPHWLKLWKKRFGDPLIDAETFRLNSDKSLVEIGNKPKSLSEVEGQYMGLLRFTPAGWNEVLRIRDGLSAAERD